METASHLLLQRSLRDTKEDEVTCGRLHIEHRRHNQQPLTVTCPQVMSPSKREYQRVMAENLGTDLSNTR